MLLKSVPDYPKRFVNCAGDRSLTTEFIEPLKTELSVKILGKMKNFLVSVKFSLFTC